MDFVLRLITTVSILQTTCEEVIAMIQQTNPRKYYDRYAVEINEAIRRTLESGWYILGKEVAAFEDEFADYLGVNHAIGVGSGTDDLYVIEDCAQAAGTMHNCQKLGVFGNMAAFSFYPTKTLGALGDAGSVITNDLSFAIKAKKLREYGWLDRISDVNGGINSRLDELQAAILRVRLNGLDKDNAERREIVNQYSNLLLRVRMPVCLHQATHVFHQYVIRSKQRDHLKLYLQDLDVPTAIHYSLPVHLQPAYSKCLSVGTLNITETLRNEILNLPMYPGLTEQEVRHVCQYINPYKIN
jgi:dTDP-4-amino-4,6-dideoxygalactose transaminase